MKYILAILVLLSFSASASAELEIIALKHRSAEELLPVIRPLLDKNDVASGMNYQLVLRASPRNIEQIRKLLMNIDVAPRRLKITVMQDADSETVARLTEISGSVGLNREAQLVLPDSSGGQDAGRGQDRLRAKVISTRSLDDERNTQQLQVLEGNRALVRTGQFVPVLQRQVIHNQWGARVIESTQYQEAGSGFYVLPRVNGDRVTLEISAQNNSFVPDSGDQPVARVQQTSGTVSGRLGEWLVASGSVQQKNYDNSTISSRGASRSNEQHTVLIRVEELE